MEVIFLLVICVQHSCVYTCTCTCMDIYPLFQMMIVTPFLLVANTGIHTCIKLNTLTLVRTWVPMSYVMVFFMFNELKDVRFVDIGGTIG